MFDPVARHRRCQFCFKATKKKTRWIISGYKAEAFLRAGLRPQSFTPGLVSPLGPLQVWTRPFPVALGETFCSGNRKARRGKGSCCHLTRKRKRVQSLKINTSVLTCEQQMDCLFQCSSWGNAVYQEWFREQIMDGRWPLGSSSSIISTARVSPPVCYQDHLCIINTNDLRKKHDWFRISMTSHTAISKAHVYLLNSTKDSTWARFWCMLHNLAYLICWPYMNIVPLPFPSSEGFGLHFLIPLWSKLPGVFL